ncbi:hypothetical protein [Streptomyces toxytricini]|uniref:hypothetical protein n=1 Tax=Streptomyces toxytricini TaxID=67369 RepID=UPI00343AE48C
MTIAGAVLLSSALEDFGVHEGGSPLNTVLCRRSSLGEEPREQDLAAVGFGQAA